MLIRRSQGRSCAALLTTALCLLVTSQSVVDGISYPGRRMSASSQRKAGNRRADLGRDSAYGTLTVQIRQTDQANMVSSQLLYAHALHFACSQQAGNL